MGKVIMLILVVITGAATLAPMVECANSMPADAVPTSIPGNNFTAMVEIFKWAMLMPTEECTGNVDRCISDTDSYIRKALVGVVDAALPAKKSEAEVATLKHGQIAISKLAKAKATGDKKQVAAVSMVYLMAADAVLKAPPADKYTVLEETFKAAAAPIT